VTSILKDEKFKQVQQKIVSDIEKSKRELAFFRKKYQRQVRDAITYIKENLPEKMRLKEIAKYAALSQFHFNRVFKRFMNKTPFEYVTERRIRRAKSLLKETSLNVTEISLQVGFESVQSFSNLFKKKVGLSPSKYRKKVLFEDA
jgi:transcriptional regulator GlxA family with amidase domain